jgi:SAM-dependent methyltransferase
MAEPGRHHGGAFSHPAMASTSSSDSVSTSAPADAAAELYRGKSGTSYHEGKRGLAPQAQEWVYRLRAEKFQHWVSETDSVFEYGVGAGWNLARLRCRRRIGFDAADFLAERVKALGIEFVPGTAALADGSVEVVICHQTLEHLLEPVVALRDMARLLTRTGRLVLHVPWEVERRYARYDPNEPNHHLYHWNAQNLGNLMAVLGWRIEAVRVRRYGYDRFAANLAARLRCGNAGFRLIRAAMVALRPLREVELVARRPEPQG